MRAYSLASKIRHLVVAIELVARNNPFPTLENGGHVYALLFG